jgi:iron complex outermembrane receptor protein
MSAAVRLIRLAAAALIGLSSGSVRADAPMPAPGGIETPIEDAPDDIEALEITGERSDGLDVQDEAQAVTVFSAEDLDRANIFNIDSLAYSVPGLHVGQSGQQALVTLRGIGTENATITGEPGVAFHVDGVNFAQPSAARLAFFDIETLDVKRGPQGLLGGKNSNSGTINVVTKKPHDEYEVSGDILFGNYDRVRARGAVNLPLGEFAATRVAFFHEDRDGYLDNQLVSDSRDPFDADDFGLRAHLRLQPTDSLDVVLTYNYFKQTGNGPQGDLVPIPKTVTCRPTGSAPDFTRFTSMPVLVACNFEQVSRERFELDPQTGRPVYIPAVNEFRPASEDADPRSIYSDLASKQDNRFWGWTGSIDWDAPVLPVLGETRVKAIGGFQRSELSFSWDFDATDITRSARAIHQDADQHSAELQWSGGFAERLEWQISGFFLRETGEEASSAGFDQTSENKSYGAALHTTLHVSDTIRFQLGGRLVKDKKSTWLLRRAGGFSGCSGPLGSATDPATRQRRPVRANPGCSLQFRGKSWGSALDWRPFDGDHLLYAKIDRGFKSGGFRSGRRGEYLPEQIWAYALGSKSSFFDNRIELNLEGFFYAYEDMQLVVFDGDSLRTENADTRMWGFDVEARASPIPGLHLSAILSHLKTETRDYFSLDPADVFNVEDFPASVDPRQVANYQRARLFARNLAEANAEEGRGGTDFANQRTCFKKPPNAGTIRCGDLGDREGLDDFSDNDLSRAPEWTFTLAAEYEISLGDYGWLTPRVQYTWQDDTYYRVFNQEFDLQESHHLTDLKLAWRSPEERWEAEVFITNIEDEAPKQNILVGSSFAGSPALAWWGAPRFYGVRVGFRY